MDNAALEIEIQQKGLIAPRVTLGYLKDKVGDKYDIVTYKAKNGKVLRWAVITMENGYLVTGDPSIAVSAENDNEEIGRKIAYENAFNKLWALEGYLLQEKLHTGEYNDTTQT